MTKRLLQNIASLLLLFLIEFSGTYLLSNYHLESSVFWQFVLEMMQITFLFSAGHKSMVFLSSSGIAFFLTSDFRYLLKFEIWYMLQNCNECSGP